MSLEDERSRPEQSGFPEQTSSTDDRNRISAASAADVLVDDEPVLAVESGRWILSGEPILIGDDLPGAALTYAAGGWAIFPCAPVEKTPITRHGCRDAATDLERVRAWWTETPAANIGVACGDASGILVIDLDGPDGIASMGELLDTHGVALEDTLTARTGSGWHFYYALPAGITIKNSVGRLGAGVDVRGEGGYTLLPPSIHPSGTTYRWARLDPVALLPSWLTVLLTEPECEPRPEPTVRPSALEDADGTTYGLAALERHADEVRRAVVGTRRDTLNRAAFACGQLVPHELNAGYLQYLLEVAANSMSEPLPVLEIATTIKNGIRDGQSKPYYKAEG